MRDPIVSFLNQWLEQYANAQYASALRADEKRTGATPSKSPPEPAGTQPFSEPDVDVTEAVTAAEEFRRRHKDRTDGETRWTDVQSETHHVVTVELLGELERAITLHPPLASAHEGYAVIKEELEELWDEIKNNQGYTVYARDEAIQVAAMAIRYIIDLDPRDEGETE